MAECLSLLTAKAPENRPTDGTAAAQLLGAVLGQLRDVESLLREAFGERSNVTWMRCDGRYMLQVSLPDGRGQKVFLETSDHEPTERLLLIYSLCCPVRPDYYEQALRLNSELEHGRLAIREVDGQSMFVMLNSYPRGTVHSEQVRRSVLEIAERADSVEFLLTGLDRY